MLNVSHYYANNSLCSTNVAFILYYNKLKNKLKTTEDKFTVDYKQPEEAADNVVESNVFGNL